MKIIIKEEKIKISGLLNIEERLWDLEELEKWKILELLGGDTITEEYEIEVDGELFNVKINSENEYFDVIVNEKLYKIKLPEGQSSNTPKKRAPRTGKKSGIISSSIPGKVVTIEVEIGSKVEEGQVCMILEAMKMQNEINAPISGIISEINCSPGSSVEANIPLIVIKPEEDS